MKAEDWDRPRIPKNPADGYYLAIVQSGEVKEYGISWPKGATSLEIASSVFRAIAEWAERNNKSPYLSRRKDN